MTSLIVAITAAQEFNYNQQKNSLNEVMLGFYESAFSECKPIFNEDAGAAYIPPESIISNLLQKFEIEIQSLDLKSLNDTYKLISNWNHGLDIDNDVEEGVEEPESNKKAMKLITTYNTLSEAILRLKQVKQDEIRVDKLARQCADYRGYLLTTLDHGLQSVISGYSKDWAHPKYDENDFKSYCNSRRDLFKNSSHYVNDNIDRSTKLAVAKYIAVCNLESSLKNQDHSATKKIIEFKKILDNVKPTIEARRDSKSIKFLKDLATVLTVGIASKVFGLWKVKGTEARKGFEETLDKDPSRTKSSR